MNAPHPHRRATALVRRDRCRQVCLTFLLGLACVLSLPSRAQSASRTDLEESAGASSATLQETSGPSVAAAAETCSFPRPQDQLWLISTRHLGGSCGRSDAPQLDVWHYEPQSGWLSSELPALLEAQRGAELSCLYIHGNRVEASAARAQGRGLYRRLVSGPEDAPPMCFVIWSWPSGQIRGQLRDVRVKAQRTNVEGYYLGYTLAQFDPRRPLSLIGYSYGSRIITGGLHVRGGGVLAGRGLSAEQLEASEPLSARVVLLAAALPNHWLAPGNYHHLACGQMDQLLLLYNSCDRVLKRYSMLDKGSRSQALGYTGMVYRSSLAAGQIEQRDACCIVGKSHEEQRYYRSPLLMHHIRRHALWEGTRSLPELALPELALPEQAPLEQALPDLSDTDPPRDRLPISADSSASAAG